MTQYRKQDNGFWSVFRTLSNVYVILFQHVLSHAQARLFVCEICDASFISQQILQSHLVMHQQKDKLTTSQWLLPISVYYNGISQLGWNVMGHIRKTTCNDVILVLVILLGDLFKACTLSNHFLWLKWMMIFLPQTCSWD